VHIQTHVDNVILELLYYVDAYLPMPVIPACNCDRGRDTQAAWEFCDVNIHVVIPVHSEKQTDEVIARALAAVGGCNASASALNSWQRKHKLEIPSC
jgi:hypothetical protein